MPGPTFSHRRRAVSGAALRVLPIGLVAACSPPPEAPEDLSELSRYLYREYEAEDPRVLSVGIGNLEAVLSRFDLDGDVDDRSFVPEDLEESDVAGVTHPDAPVSDNVPTAVARMSAYAVDWHALLQTESDQLPAEPTATYYLRHFEEPEDPSCFAGRSCESLRTLNDITRSNLLYEIAFEMPKTMRWVDVWVDGEPTDRRGIVARSWIERSYTSEDGDTDMVQSFTLDVWIEGADGRTLRYQSLWAEVTIPGVPEETIQYFTQGGIDDALAAGDSAIEELYSP